MNTDQGRLSFAAGIDNSQLRNDAAESRNILRSISSQAVKNGNEMNNVLLNVGKTIGGVFALGQIKQFAMQIISLRGEMQKLEVSFQTLAGKDKGNALFKEIKEFAVSTPMMMKDLAQGAQTMLAFNIEAENVMPILKAIGDISMGDAQKFNSLTLAFSQMSATGKLMGQDLLQMINAGFNPLAVISEKTGKTIGELKEEMEQGKITTDKVTQAFMDATSEGGKFHGMLENQSKGIAGSISNLQGAIDDMMNDIGSAAEGTIVTAVNAATSLVKNYEQVGRVLTGVIATYGTYKAALMVVTAAKGWATAAEALHYNWLLLVEKAQKMLNATMLSNPYVLVATLIAGVVAAMVSMKTEAERIKEVDEQYEAQKNKVIEAEQKHREEIDRLCDVAGDEALSTDTRRLALYKLEEKYPDIFAKYKTETDMLENIKRIKQEIAELDGKKSVTNPANELAQVNKRIAVLEAKAANLHEEWVEANGSGTKMKKVKTGGLTPDEQRELTVLKNKRTTLQRQTKKAEADAYFANLTGISDDELKRQIEVRKNLLAKMNMSGKKYGKITGNIPQAGTYTREELQTQLQNLQRQQAYRDAESKSGAQWVADKKKAYQDAQKAYNDYVNGVTSKGVKEEDFEKRAKELKDEMEAAKKAYDKVKPSSNSGAKKAANVSHSNAQMLAKEADERKQQSEEYARRMADQEIDNEFEIRQARIDAMQDGLDKELLQNKLNYDRLEEQNKRRLREMLDNLAEERLRQKEEKNPTIFKNKGKDGRLEDDPGKRDEELKTIRLSLTVDDLTSEQKQQFEEFDKIATSTFERSNKESLDKILGDVLTYEEQRLKITEEYARKRNELYEKNEDGSIKTDSEGNKVLRKGVSQGNLDELNRQEEEALNNIDVQFASREETFQAWCDEIANLSLKNLNKVLEKAQKDLDALKKSGNADPKQLAKAEAKVATAQKAVNKKKAENELSPGKKNIKEWEDLQKQLTEVTNTFGNMGDAIGGTIGEIVSQCQQFAYSTMTMINGIVTLVNSSASAMKATGEAGAESLSTMEKASVILTIISAALQIAMAIANLFNDDAAKQKEIDNLQERIDQLQWELDHQEIENTKKRYGPYIEEVKKALEESTPEIIKNSKLWRTFGDEILSTADKNEIVAKSAEKLAKYLGNVAYTADKAFGDDRYKSANEQLKNIAEQQVLIQKQIDLQKSKKKPDEGEIQEMEQAIEELGQDALDLINEMVEDIIGDTSTGIAEELADAFFEAFEAGEDAAEAWGDKVNEIVADVLKRMLITKFLEEPLGEIFDKYKAKWFKDGDFQGLQVVIDSMGEFAQDLRDEGAAFAEIWDQLPEDVKNMITAGSEFKREASQRGIATADQDSVDELNGRMTAVQSHTYSISENTKLLLSTTQSILQSVMNIESETDGFSARMERMEGNIKTMTNTLDDIATKGIRLKS